MLFFQAFLYFGPVNGYPDIMMMLGLLMPYGTKFFAILMES